MTTSSSSSSSPIVIEFGSSSIKVGIAGETEPRCIFPSFNITTRSNNSLAQRQRFPLSFQSLPPLPLSSMSHSHSEDKNNADVDNNGISKLYYSHLSPFLHSLFTHHLHLKHTYPMMTSGTPTNHPKTQTLQYASSSLLSSKSKNIIILLPTYYSQSYVQTLKYIFYNELQISQVQFIPKSNLYTTLPYALGKSVGIVIDCYTDGVSGYGGGITIGAYFDKQVLDETIVHTTINKHILIQNVYHQIIMTYHCSDVDINEDIYKNDCGANREDDDDDYFEVISNLVEEILMTLSSSTSSSLSSSLIGDIPSKIKITIDEIIIIIKQCIHDLYFNMDNPHSLVYTFLSCIIKCPIDLRLELIRNVCFIGDGVININGFEIEMNLEREFMTAIQNVFEKVNNANKDTRRLIAEERQDELHQYEYIIKDEHHRGKFQCLANLIMVKGPLTLIYPLPYSPLCISWVGGSVLGCLDSSR